MYTVFLRQMGEKYNIFLNLRHLRFLMAVSGSFHKSIDGFLTNQEKVMVSKVITW